MPSSNRTRPYYICHVFSIFGYISCGLDRNCNTLCDEELCPPTPKHKHTHTYRLYRPLRMKQDCSNVILPHPSFALPLSHPLPSLSHQFSSEVGKRQECVLSEKSSVCVSVGVEEVCKCVFHMNSDVCACVFTRRNALPSSMHPLNIPPTHTRAHKHTHTPPHLLI